MMKVLSSFGTAGVWTAVLVTLVNILFSLSHIPLDAPLTLVWGTAFWVLLMLVARHILIRRDVRTTRRLIESIDVANSDHDYSGSLHDFLSSAAQDGTTILGRSALPARKVSLLITSSSEQGRPELVNALLEDARQAIACWYITVDALVWALPALGFLGTALHLRNAVDVFVTQAQNSPNVSVRSLALLTPSLMAALTIITMALGLTVLCYLAAAATLKEDYLALNSTNDLLMAVAAGPPTQDLRVR